MNPKTSSELTDDTRHRLLNDSAVPVAVIRETLDYLMAAAVHRRAVFTTSMGLEDMVVGDLIVRANLSIELVTLDTGRLYPETYNLIAQAQDFWQRDIAVMFPQAELLQQLVADQGINGFRDSVDARLACCGVRKLEPLSRALDAADAWVTGLRHEQNEARKDAPAQEWLQDRQLTKYNPLINWSSDDVHAYLSHRQVPTNPLHEQGFPSIGCAPCTRAITAGENERAGRWWWEQDSASECGLHLNRPLKKQTESLSQ